MLCDNSTVVTNINSMGGIRSPSCNQIAHDLWDWCVDNNTWLTVTHIARMEDTEADKESRSFNDRIEWTLKRGIFEQITTHWGIPEIDLLDLMHSSLGLSLGSLIQPLVLWMHLLSVGAHSIFMLFHLSVKLTQMLRVPQGIMILPHWPTQVWWPQLLRMIIAIPLVLLRNQDLLSLSHSPRTLYPLREKLTLLASLLSGSPSRMEKFQR